MAAEESKGTMAKSADHQISFETPDEGAKEEEAKSYQITPETPDANACEEDKSSQLPEPSLTISECTRLERLGLGIAVDITEKHSWGKKSAFQAKEVKRTKDRYLKDLIVINESNQFKKYLEVVESYSEVQTALESSFRPSPNVPIDVSIAADFHRSFRNKKSINGKTVLTRTIAFRTNAPITRAAEKEVFEVQLNEWLEKSNSIQKGDANTIIPEECKIPNYKPKKVDQPSGTATPANDGKKESFWYYTPDTNHSCIGYLRALGGVTHYVSSITLGASEYHVETEKLLNLSLSQSTGAHVDRFATATVKSHKKKKQFVSRSKTEAIGRVPALERGKPKDLLPFRSKDEAVVRCSFTSLSNLVTHPHLQKELEAAIQEYIDFQLHGTRGPYHIATAEEVEELEEGTRGRLYWRVKPDDSTLPPSYQITYTPDPEKEASNFYLKPFEENYFLIATDPEDPRTANQLKKKKLKATTSQPAVNPEVSHTSNQPKLENQSTATDTEDPHTPNQPKTDDPSKATTSQPGTDPEVSHMPNQSKMENQPTAADTEDPHTPNQPKIDDPSKATATSPANSAGPKDQHTLNQPHYARAPQRFVYMNPKNKHLSVKMVIDKKKSAFKLKDPHSRLTQSLSKSQWLPEAALGSQPYFIQPRGSSYRHKLVLTMPEGQPRTDMPERQPHTDMPERQPHTKHVIAHVPSESIFHRQLFILEPGHPT